MRLTSLNAGRPRTRKFGFTLAEVVVALAIVAMVFSGMLVAYIQAAKRAQWSGYSLAAQALAIQQIEQARCADWDPTIRNEITNLALINPNLSVGGQYYTFKGYSWTNLDLPTSGGKFVPATNFVRVTMIHSMQGVTAIPGVNMQMIRVDTVWPFVWGGISRLYTNTICTFVAPDNHEI